VEVGGEIQHVDVLESHIFQSAIGGPDVRAVLHGAAAAIDDEAGAFRQFCNGRLQGRDAFRFAGRAHKLRTRDVALTIQEWEGHAQDSLV